MGWLQHPPRSRDEVIQTLLEKKAEVWTMTYQYICHGRGEGTLWSVRAKGDQRWVQADLFKSAKDKLWETKTVLEAAGPADLSCPVDLLGYAPVACEDWREAVWALHHKRQKAKDQAISKRRLEKRVARALTKAARAEVDLLCWLIKRGELGWVTRGSETEEVALLQPSPGLLARVQERFQAVKRFELELAWEAARSLSTEL